MRSKLRQALSLLLCAVLLAALFPFSALAYPPEDGDPTHKHNWLITWQQEPSCEEEGIILWTCSACGKEYWESSPALGHDWDNGVVTQEPEGFTPGVRTYTCKNDPSHTKTEAINPILPLVQAQLGWVWIDPYTFGLHITVHPEGGRISRGSSDLHTMTVEAEGGTGEYTYTWYYVDNSGSVSTTDMDTALMAGSATALGGYSGASAAFLEAFASAYKDTEYANYPTVDLNDIPTRPDFFGSRSSGCLGEGEASYSASIGNCSYFCVVTDAAGQKATSHTARVEYCLSVRTQPENTNLPAGGNAPLFCEACDGTGNYTYSWLKADGSPAQGSTPIPGTLIVQEPGDYCCVISDGVEEVTTRTATVYEAETLAPVDWSKDVTMWPEEETELFVKFTGGTPPYHCEWTQNGQTVAEDNDDTPLFTIMAKNNQSYLCTVTDDKGQSSWVAVRAGVRELAIAKQPESGMLDENGRYELSVEMAEGMIPFTYTLRYIGSNAYHYEVYSGTENSREVTYPAAYYFHIEDAAGHTADSDLALVEDRYFRIKDQSKSAVIDDSTVGTRIFVEAEGGKEPYHYRWYVERDEELLHEAGVYAIEGNDCPELYAKTPGRYYCIVEDSSGYTNSGIWYADGGVSIASDWIDVSYEGEAPCIVLQPFDILFDYSEESQSWGLICDAVPGSGGSAEDLIFEWYFKAPGYTDFIKLGSGESRKILDGIYYPGCNGYSPTRNCGWYYCKVTDSATGKSTDSRIAAVDVAITVPEAYTYGLDSDSQWLDYTIEGGYPPYTVQIYFWRSKDYGDPGEPVLSRTRHFTTGGFHAELVPLTHDYYYVSDGASQRGTLYSLYFLVITDALGQRYEYYANDLCHRDYYWTFYLENPHQSGTVNGYYFFDPNA